MNKFIITYLYKKGLINNIDLALGQLIQRLDPKAHAWVAVAATLVSQWASRGHVCLDLGRTDDQFLHFSESETRLSMGTPPEQGIEHLKESTAIGRPGELRPLILDGTRLYLQRLWHYEHTLALNIMTRIRQKPWPPVDENRLKSVVQRYFSDPADSQFQSAMTAGQKSICIISGGPGSGKTYTIARIILILMAMADGQSLRIALAAPTGKAAARLQDSVSESFAALQHNPASLADQPPKAATLHRLLGYSPATGQFRYHGDNPLPMDSVIVDEASMVDLGLMARLMAALPQRARLILVGDKDQLSSVEAGAVLGDICSGVSPSPPAAESLPADDEPGEEPPALLGHIAVLTQNYRFGSQSGIAALCAAINQGDEKRCLSLLEDVGYPDIVLRSPSGWRELKTWLSQEIISQIAPMFQMPSAAEALAHLNRFRFLTAVRKGLFGVQMINGLIEEGLRHHALIPGNAQQWYPHRPLMITSNDYLNELFNGDVGMVERAEDDPRQMVSVVFEDGKGGYRRLAPHQLPPHETVYAMTVHKSQGSEFDHVFFVLPDRDLPLLTRELIYTAVTRARKSVTIWGDRELLAKAIQRRTQRASGLREALWG